METFGKIKGSFLSLGTFQKVSIVVVGAATAAAIAFVVRGADSGSYLTVAEGLVSRADVEALTHRLEASGVPSRVAGDGRAVEVPEDQFATALRVATEREALPKKHAGMIADIVQKNPMLLSREERRMLGIRTLESRIEENIETYDMVQNVSVHLSIPPRAGFARERSEAKASVILTLQPGYAPTRLFLQTVRDTVSYAVDGLEPGNISLSDSHGSDLRRVLEEPIETAEGTADQLLLFTDRYEKLLERKICGILRPLFGQENLSVSVTAQCRLPSERGAAPGEETHGQRQRAEGAASYFPEGSASTRSISDALALSGGPGRPSMLSRLFVCVLINARIFPDGRLSDSMREKALSLVKAAAGFSAVRDDMISVVGAPFQVADEALLSTVSAPRRAGTTMAALYTASDMFSSMAGWIWGGGTMFLVLALFTTLRLAFPAGGSHPGFNMTVEPVRRLPGPSGEHAVLMGMSAQEVHILLESGKWRDLAIVLKSAKPALRDWILRRVDPEDRELLLAQLCFVSEQSAGDLARAKERLFEALHGLEGRTDAEDKKPGDDRATEMA